MVCQADRRKKKTKKQKTTQELDVLAALIKPKTVPYMYSAPMFVLNRVLDKVPRITRVVHATHFARLTWSLFDGWCVCTLQW